VILHDLLALISVYSRCCESHHTVHITTESQIVFPNISLNMLHIENCFK